MAASELTVPATPATTARPQPTVATRAVPWQLLAVVGLTLLGLALRLWFISVNQLQPIYSPADDGDYYQRALRFATTGVYLDDFWLIRPPLHVLIFASLIKLSVLLGNVDALLLIRLFQIAMITATIPLGYDLVRRLCNRTAGLIVAGILAVWYPLVELPAHLFSEPTFFFFLVLHLWLLLRWRDERRWVLLAFAGMALGFGSLARSTTLYGGVFAVLYLVLETRSTPLAASTPWGWLRAQGALWLARLREWHWWRAMLGNVAVFGVFVALIVLPWTARNYAVYQRLIPIDTIGSVNLWLHVEKYPEKGVEILKTMPQRDRHVFAVEDTRRMYAADPPGFVRLLWRNAIPHFQHIWKAQFIEDFTTRRSFYGRPLREAAPLGFAGDLLWLIFTTAGFVALMLPIQPREGGFRMLALAWLGYTTLGMMLFHIEPRYLLPIWLFLAIYGAALLGNPRGAWQAVRQHWWHTSLALLLLLSYLLLVFSYRDYPTLISRAVQREMALAQGYAAYQQGDFGAARTAFERALDAHEEFSETRAVLALTAIAQHEYATARDLLGASDAQHTVLARGMLARAEGDLATAVDLLVDAEKRSGVDLQQYALRLAMPATDHVDLGSGLDLGYIAGFSSVEQTPRADGSSTTYRWLQGRGTLRLPLAAPLDKGAGLILHMTAGQPVPVPVRVTFADGSVQEFRVASGAWRLYRLTIPPTLTGDATQRELVVTLDAPVFIAAHRLPDSRDTRPLSLMLDQVRVE